MAVKKRGDRWHYDFMIRRVRYRGAIPEARTKAQAEKVEAKIRLEIYEGRYGTCSHFKTLAEFVEEVYVPYAKANKRSYHTSDVYHVKVILEYFGDKALNEITPMLIEKFKRERANTPVKGDKPRSAASTNRELDCLSKIFSMARDNRLINENPVSRVKHFREDNKRTRYLTEDEEQILMSALTGGHSYLKPIVLVALHTGMRQGEILKLRWPQVDFHRGCIHVANTKSGKDRAIPMNEPVRVELMTLRESANGSEHVFGDKLPNVKMSFKAACVKAGIEDFRFHDLRHTAATRMADSGIDAFTIAAILGHSTLQMVSRYTHATNDNKRRAVEALSKYGQKNCHKIVTSIAERRKSASR